MSKISYIEIDDPINQTNHAIEVTITLKDGTKRWCFFMTPDISRNCGDFVKDTNVRIHKGVNHMLMVSEVSRDIIYKVLNNIDEEGDIEGSTLPL